MAPIIETTTTTTALAEPLADGKKIEPPKKAQSPLVLWGRAGALAAIKAAHPEWSRPDVLRALSKNWEALSAGAQKPWFDRAAEDQKRFDAEKAAYDETPEGKAALAAVEEEPPAKKPRTKAPASATQSVEKPKKKQQVLKPLATPVDLPTGVSELTTAEKAAVLRSISEAGGSARQKDIQHAAERILGAPPDALATKGRAIWALAGLKIDHSVAGRELVVVPDDDDELPSDDEGDDNDIMPASQPRGPPRDRSKASVAFVGGEDDDSVVEEELEVEELIEVEIELGDLNPEPAAVLKAIHEADDSATLNDIWRAAEVILRVPSGSLEAKKSEIVEVIEAAKKRPRAKAPVKAPAPKKAKKKPEKKSDVLVALALALEYGHRSTLFLRCLGAKDPSWDGSRPIPERWVPEVALGYPIGTHEKTVGSDMFMKKTPSIKGIYTLSKVNYKPVVKRGQRQEKTGEKVYYRKVEESDVEAIKEAFPHLVF